MNAGKTSGILTEKAAIDLQHVLKEASQWIKDVTGKTVEPSNFRAELENGIILCELIERIHPGSIKRINRMNIAMAHLDNLKQFLNACEKFGLKDSQLFDVTDLQIQNTLRLKSGGIKHTTADRRLRNVCVTIYWLGRRLSQTPGYTGPQLNLDAFREILDLPVNPSAFYLQGYESTPLPYHDSNTTPQSRQKQSLVTTTCEIDLEPMSAPPRVEIKTMQKPPDVIMPTQEENGLPDENREDLTPDELIATIQSAVDELLLDYQPTAPQEKKAPAVEQLSSVEVLQRNERSYSSPSPSSVSSPSPNPAQPLPLFLDLKIICKPGVSLGLQLIGGADTAIPAQVEIVMPGKPAETCGLRAGDIIISVEDHDVTRFSHHQLIDFIKQSVGKGTLLLGVERSVDIPASVQKSESKMLEEEHAERERQKKEIASMYNLEKTPSNGTQLKTEDPDDDKEEEEEEERNDEQYHQEQSDKESEKDETEVDLDIQWQLPTSDQPNESPHLTTESSSVDQLQEQLEALNNMVSKKQTSDTAGIGQIIPNVAETVNIAEPEHVELSENPEFIEREDSESNRSANSGSGRGSRNSRENGETVNEFVSSENLPSLRREPEVHETNGIAVSLHSVEKWKSSRPQADGKEESVTRVTSTTSTLQNNDVEEVDPFAPIVMKNSNSSHLLSDVLSLHKSEFKTANNTVNSSSHSNKASYSSYQTTPSRPNHHSMSFSAGSGNTAPSSRSHGTTANNSYGSVSRHHSFGTGSLGNSSNNPSSIAAAPPSRPSTFETQDEIQEMHGIKVRAVQRTRWTPENNRSNYHQQYSQPQQQQQQRHPPSLPVHSASFDQSQSKKSAIYERRDVVLMEVRGMKSQGNSSQHYNNSSSNTGYNQHDHKRPWSSQPRRMHHNCSHCRGPIYQGPMMAIPDKDLYFHQKCLVCVVCRSSVSMNYGRATVFLRHSLPHCTSCYSNDNGIKVTTC